MDTPPMTYSQALIRLEKIVKQIDSNELEIDALSQALEEANQLISFCNDKLTKADSQIEKMLADKQNTE
ncbi:MAG: exodeoxyribonuclease VII small subunit [Prevotellaceae bacterium]|jgi:exodeoxyribonuclease VII small subunit|nr:exodeoxyribonuclease VII small subunit [Prevotellaceae bacterium]